MKFITTNSEKQIGDALEELLKNLCNSSPTQFNALEKSKLLLTVRSVCVQPTLDLVFTCSDSKKTFNVTIDLITVIDQITKFKIGRAHV